MQTTLKPLRQQFEQNLPKSIFCTDDYSYGQRIRSKSSAIKHLYINPNSPWERSIITLDVDRQYAPLAWEDHLPEPSFTTMNPKSGHAHLSWMLNKPVLTGYSNNAHPMRYLASIEHAMTRSIGADAGYGGSLTQNPLNEHWITTWGPSTYDLGDFKEYVTLPKALPKKKEAAGLGRNCDAFDDLRFFAYKEVLFWKESGKFSDWQEYLYKKAYAFTTGEHTDPLGAAEVQSIAKSVAKWTWEKFSREKFIEKQAHRSQLGVMARKKTSAERRIQAVEMKAGGANNKLISDALGVSSRTVRRFLASESAKDPLKRVTSDMGYVHPLVTKPVDNSSSKKVVETKKRPDVRETVRADKQDLSQVVKLHLDGKAPAEIVEATGLPMREVFAHILTAQKQEII